MKMIFANHAHVFPKEIRAEGSVESLMKFLDECEIDKAVAFAEKYGIEKVYPSIDEMFADEDVDIIYITTPHNTHYGFMKKALEMITRTYMNYYVLK